MDHPRVRVRFAPSPTGFLHIGGLRTALYNELLAKQQGGDFILRVEDTDRERFVEGGIENVCQSLRDCGVEPNEGVWLDGNGAIVERGDAGPYIQSKRKKLHSAYAQRLIKMNKAYYCFCTTERLQKLRQDMHAAGKPTMYDGKCRDLLANEAQKRVDEGEHHVIRLKLPKKGKIKIWDIIRDDIDFDWVFIDDQIIIKSDGYPTYHLAATCDDHDMKISHVIRGEEWLPSTPKHLFIYEAFGWTPPKFAHLPLLLNSDHSKLSKRQGDVAVTDYLAKGYLPEVLINFVALLGWNPTADQEIYTHDDLISLFDLAKVNKSGAVFNLEKLNWMNEHYLRKIPEERYFELTLPFIEGKTGDREFAERCLRLVRDRIQKPSEVEKLTAYFFEDQFDFSKVRLPWKTQTQKKAYARLQSICEPIKNADDALFRTSVSLETFIKKLIDQNGWSNGDTLWPLRVALSGREKSPTPFELLWVYGKKRSLKRLHDAIMSLSTSMTDDGNPFILPS